MPTAMKINATQSDERREWLRIDDRVLLEYRLITDPEGVPTPDLPPASDQTIADAIHKPAADFLHQSGKQR